MSLPYTWYNFGENIFTAFYTVTVKPEEGYKPQKRVKDLKNFRQQVIFKQQLEKWLSVYSAFSDNDPQWLIYSIALSPGSGTIWEE